MAASEPPAALRYHGGMTVLLAIDTSGALCSLAIHADGRWFEHTHKVERLHNQVVLQDLDRLTTLAGVPRNTFRAVAFGAGPGSFTGVRIAAAVAQGIAFASGGQVVAIRSSLALVTVAGAHLEPPAGSEAERLLAVTRSRRDAYYVAGYQRRAGGEWQLDLDEQLHQGEELPAALTEPWAGAGDRPPWWPPSWRFVETSVERGPVVTARVIGELALAALARGEGLPPSAAVPFYVVGDSPWKPAAS